MSHTSDRLSDIKRCPDGSRPLPNRLTKPAAPARATLPRSILAAARNMHKLQKVSCQFDRVKESACVCAYGVVPDLLEGLPRRLPGAKAPQQCKEEGCDQWDWTALSDQPGCACAVVPCRCVQALLSSRARPQCANVTRPLCLQKGPQLFLRQGVAPRVVQLVTPGLPCMVLPAAA